MPFTDDTLEFLVRNRLTDSRPWFHEHREEYEKLVVEPMAELVTALTGGLLGSDAAERNAAQIRQWVAPAHEG